MMYSETSARDPVFWRWHKDLEDIMREHRDQYNPRYTSNDFDLTSGVGIAEVKTIVSNGDASTSRDVENILFTHWENAQILHSADTPITYNRLNHIQFKYSMKLLNKEEAQQNVLIRIFLGQLKDGSVDSDTMVEMDQFSHTLSGETEEMVERRSIDSAATTKDLGMPLRNFMDLVNATLRGEEVQDSGSWCGIPHHLLVPRSTAFEPEAENLGASEFALVVIVTDAPSGVDLGNDGVPHMICGHRDYLTKELDKKSFGFPFDRNTINLDGMNKFRFATMSKVKILYRTRMQNQRDLGEKIDEMMEKETTTSATTTNATSPAGTTTNATTRKGETSTTKTTTIDDGSGTSTTTKKTTTTTRESPRRYGDGSSLQTDEDRHKALKRIYEQLRLLEEEMQSHD